METSTVETTGEQQMGNVEPMASNQEMAADESASAHVIIDEQVIDKTRMTQSRQMTSNKTTKIIERNVRGQVVTVNRLKHYAFIKRTDHPKHRDLFAREASTVGETQKPKFLVLDRCVFDIIKTSRGVEAVNIEVLKRNTSDISRLKKIPKKKVEQTQTTSASVLFRTTIIELFREATKTNK